MIDLNGLAVVSVVSARGSVPYVSDCHRSSRKLGKALRRENLGDKPKILVGDENAVIIDYDSASLLTSVLKGIKTVIAIVCDVSRLGSDYAKHPAFLVNCLIYAHFLPPSACSNAAPTKPLKSGWHLLGRLLNSG